MGSTILEFKNYVSNFDMNDENICLKYEHSIRVANISRQLGRDLHLSKKEIQLVELIGLLHDYGRFYQWQEYHTYQDLDSIDHGDLSVEILFDHNEIKNYWQGEEDYDDIYAAIKYHNKYEVPKEITGRRRLFCNIIRDADKIDILYLISKNKHLLEVDDGEISLKVKETFKQKQLIKRSDIKTNNDMIILSLAYIYDLNDIVSFKYLKEHRTIENIYDSIANKKRFKIYFETIFNYIESKIKGEEESHVR